MLKLKVIVLWLVICLCSCFGDLINDSNSTKHHQLTSQVETKNLFPNQKQLLDLKKAISRVREDMHTIEIGLLDDKIDKKQLLLIQKKAYKKMQLLERRVSKFIHLTSSKLKKPEQHTKPHKLISKEIDLIEKRFKNSNNLKLKSSLIEIPKFFFLPSTQQSMSSSYSSLESSSTNPLFITTISMDKFSNLSSSVNYTSTPSSLVLSNHQLLKDKTGDNDKNINTYDRNRKNSFLFYHQCSSGFLQINNEKTLNTGLDPNLLSNSEIIIEQANNYSEQIHLKTKTGKYICINKRGSVIIKEKLSLFYCTFYLKYQENKEYLQIISVRKPNWILAFNQKGLLIKTSLASQNLSNYHQCTIFVRQRSDKQLIKKFINLNEVRAKFQKKINERYLQLKRITKRNDPIMQDSLIINKLVD